MIDFRTPQPRLPNEPDIEEMLAWFDVYGWGVTIDGHTPRGFVVTVGDAYSPAKFQAGPRSLVASLRDVYYKARAVDNAERDAWNSGARQLGVGGGKTDAGSKGG